MTDYLSQAEAARRLHLSPQRVFALVKAGKIKTKEVGGRPLISEQELDRFAAIPRKDGRPSSKA
jgi:excisionase family DNA binding protein